MPLPPPSGRLDGPAAGGKSGGPVPDGTPCVAWAKCDVMARCVTTQEL